MDRSLRQFLAIAELGSINAAARALNVTQPTLTFNLRKLEGELGMQLVTRSPQGTRLTQYGQTLYDNAKLMQRLYENALATMHNQKVQTEHGISIACGYTWWHIFIKEMIFEYRTEYPSAAIQVSIGNQLRCLEQLLSGDVTLFVAAEIEDLSSSAGAEFIPLGRIYNAYFAREDHPLAGEIHSRAEIGTYPSAFSAPPESRYKLFFEEPLRESSARNLFQRSSFEFASNSMSACIEYVRRTDAILQHTQLMAPVFEEMGLTEVRQSEAVSKFTSGIYVLSERRREPRVASLLDRVVEAGREAFRTAAGQA